MLTIVEVGRYGGDSVCEMRSFLRWGSEVWPASCVVEGVCEMQFQASILMWSRFCLLIAAPARPGEAGQVIT